MQMTPTRRAVFAISMLFMHLPVTQAGFLISTFEADVTIPIGHRCMGVLPLKSRSISDPLEAKGFVLLGSGKPIVVVAVDWCEIRNGAYDQWREALAAATETSRERVLVTSLHQHDAPVTDAGAAKLLRDVGLTNELYDEDFHQSAVAAVANAARKSIARAVPMTHVGTGQAKVMMIASNRRVVLEDGRVTFGRGSSSGGNKFHSNAPLGEIDPFVKTISFWNEETAIVAMSVYATHPMSRYGEGKVSADFVGLARRLRQQDLPNVMQIYASGCSGDITAGKFNDGSDEAREQLVTRLHDGMKAAWDATQKTAIRKLEFRSSPLKLEFYQHGDLEPEKLKSVVEDPKVRTEDRILAAMGLSSYQRVTSGQPIDFPCIDFGDTQLLLFPGEAFVDYQLMAQQMKPDSFVVSMGYGECWPGYIPMNASFGDGFHDKWLWVPFGSENRVQAVLQKLLSP